MVFRVLWLILLGVVGSEALASPAPPARPNARLRMEITAYCTKGETASGEQTRRGIVAADPKVLPLGSRVRVDGLGRPHDRVYDVEDTGREVKGRELDIFMHDCQAAKRFGRRTARIQVLRVGGGPASTTSESPGR
jgi:3D (Asp-Asp-Asp) domain-containing protein